MHAGSDPGSGNQIGPIIEDAVSNAYVPVGSISDGLRSIDGVLGRPERDDYSTLALAEMPEGLDREGMYEITVVRELLLAYSSPDLMTEQEVIDSLERIDELLGVRPLRDEEYGVMIAEQGLSPSRFGLYESSNVIPLLQDRIDIFLCVGETEPDVTQSLPERLRS